MGVKGLMHCSAKFLKMLACIFPLIWSIFSITWRAKVLNPDRLRQRAFYLNFGYCPEQIYLKLKTSRKAQLSSFHWWRTFFNRADFIALRKTRHGNGFLRNYSTACIFDLLIKEDFALHILQIIALMSPVFTEVA